VAVLVDWNDTIMITFGSNRYSSDKGVKVVVPRSYIKGLKQVANKDYSSGVEKQDTIILMDIASIRLLNLNITLELIHIDNPHYLHEFRVEEEFKVLLGLLQGSPAAKILHGE